MDKTAVVTLHNPPHGDRTVGYTACLAFVGSSFLFLSPVEGLQRLTLAQGDFFSMRFANMYIENARMVCCTSWEDNIYVTCHRAFLTVVSIYCTT